MSKYSTWMLSDCANILSLDEMVEIMQDWRRNVIGGVDVIATSVPGVVLHPGHVTCILDSFQRVDEYRVAKLGSEYKGKLPWTELIILVNGDEFLRRKYGRVFMPLKTRCQMISAIKQVEWVVPFEPSDPNDTTVCEALSLLNPNFFVKGGDRTIDNLPEREVCETLGIKIITGAGDNKSHSSSDYLNNWSKGEYRFG